MVFLEVGVQILLKGSGNGGEVRREVRQGWKAWHDVLECVWLVKKRWAYIEDVG